MNTQFARLNGLQPDQVYYFVIKDDAETSKRFWFRTASDIPKRFTFIAGGDTKSDGAALEAGRQSNEMVAKIRPLFVIFDGDFCSGDGTRDDWWHQWLDDWFMLTTTSDGRMFPLIPIHGNHEDGDMTVLNKLFDAPFQYGNEDHVYYSLSLGGDLFHIIALNSQHDELEKQTRWLESNLQSHQDFTFKIAGYHKPFRPHTSRKRENDHLYDVWAPLFYKYGLNLAIEGDSHMSKITYPIKPSNTPDSHAGFIRDDENGTMFIGEGAWGASYRPNDDDKPWTLRSGSFNQIKWIQVFPMENGLEARADIRTIMTSKRDDNDDDKIISFVDNVGNLDESDVFRIPQNIKFFSTPEHGEVISYPYKSKSE
jgi:hypothetical protein